MAGITLDSNKNIDLQACDLGMHLSASTVLTEPALSDLARITLDSNKNVDLQACELRQQVTLI